MSRSLTIDHTGRVVIPIELRRQLGLAAGARLRVDVVDQRLMLTPLPETSAGDFGRSPSGRLVLPAGHGPFDAAAATRAERHDKARRLGR